MNSRIGNPPGVIRIPTITTPLPLFRVYVTFVCCEELADIAVCLRCLEVTRERIARTGRTGGRSTTSRTGTAGIPPGVIMLADVAHLHLEGVGIRIVERQHPPLEH